MSTNIWFLSITLTLSIWGFEYRRIYIANFILILPFTLARKLAKFQFHETSRFFGW